MDSSGGITDSNTYISSSTPITKVPANMKLVRGYHYYDSLRNIVSNTIVATDENMWNKVDIITSKRGNWFGADFNPRTPSGYDIISALANDQIWKEKIKTKVCNEPNAKTTKVAWGYAMGNLTLGMNEMYSGDLTILGDPTIKPHDVVFINDYYTDMNGPFEVREVNHHFSHDTGFITTIIPDLIVYTNNAMAMASDAVAGGWYDDVANGIFWGHNIKTTAANKITGGNVASVTNKGTSSTPALNTSANPVVAPSSQGQVANGNSNSGFFINRAPFIRVSTIANSIGTVLGGAASTVASTAGTVASNIAAPLIWAIGKTGVPEAINELVSSMQFATGGWSLDRREPINFIPLIYSNRPYIAGVEGWRRSDWWETGFQNMQRYVYNYTQAASYIQKLATSIHVELGDGTGGNI